MTADNVPMQDPNEQQPLVTEEVVKPKRTRRTKTAESSPAAEGAAPSELSAAVSEEPPPVPAKKATRRKKAAEAVPEAVSAAEAVQAAAPAAVEAVEVAEAAPPAKPKRAPRKKAVEAVAETEAAPEVEASAPRVAASHAAPQPALPREETPHGFFQLAPESADPVETAASGEAGEAEGAREAGRREERGNRRDRDRQRGPRNDRGPRPERQPVEMAADEEGASGEQGDAEGGEHRPSRRAAIAAEQATEVFQELLSGDFDKQREEEAEEATSEESGPYKRVLRPEPDAPKLQKVLAQAGVGSRRDIEQMIEEGRIEVNDQVAHIGQRISYGDRIKVAGRPIKVRISPPPARILAYHKPVGEVVTHDDPQGRPTVFRRLPRLSNGKWMSVGRLDLNTEGLLLFTNSGELANQLMHPRFGVEREYAVRVLGSLDDASRAKLLSGVEIEGQPASFVSISNGLGEGVNQWYRVVITEGRNREVRKLFDAVGLTVNRLIRVRYGAIVLPRGLKRGVWVELGESDVRAVKALAGMDQQRQEAGGGQHGRGGKGQHKGQQQQQGFKGKQHGRNGGPQQGQHGPQGPRQGGGFNSNKPPRGPMQEQRPQAAPRHEGDEDFDHIGPIPNPLEQTFDKRFVKGSKRITSGFGRPDQDHGHGGGNGPGGAKQKGPRQPDPMQTSVGYIGADAYFGKAGGNRRGGGGGGGGGRGRR